MVNSLETFQCFTNASCIESCATMGTQSKITAMNFTNPSATDYSRIERLTLTFRKTGSAMVDPRSTRLPDSSRRSDDEPPDCGKSASLSPDDIIIQQESD
jgi:hypothetical protein